MYNLFFPPVSLPDWTLASWIPVCLNFKQFKRFMSHIFQPLPLFFPPHCVFVCVRWTWCQNTSGARTSWCVASTWKMSRRRRHVPWPSFTCWAGQLMASPPPHDHCLTSAGKKLSTNMHADCPCLYKSIQINICINPWNTSGHIGGFESRWSPSCPSLFCVFHPPCHLSVYMLNFHVIHFKLNPSSLTLSLSLYPSVQVDRFVF